MNASNAEIVSFYVHIVCCTVFLKPSDCLKSTLQWLELGLLLLISSASFAPLRRFLNISFDKSIGSQKHIVTIVW